MTVFAVVVSEPERCENMGTAIVEHFAKENFLRVGECFWLIDSSLPTSRELTLLLTGGDEVNKYDIRSFLVIPITSYYGLHNKITWEWLQAKGI